MEKEVKYNKGGEGRMFQNMRERERERERGGG